MEEKKLSETESLELITTMIRNARTNLRARINCNMLLVVGYMTVFAGIAIWILKQFNVFHLSSFLWFVVPAVCYPVTRYMASKDTTHIKSYLDKIIDYISILFVVICSTTAISSNWIEYPVFFVESLLIGIWIIIIGLLIKYKPVIWGGILGIVIAHGLLFVSPNWQIPIFTSIFIFSIIIPGHLFKKSISPNV